MENVVFGVSELFIRENFIRKANHFFSNKKKIPTVSLLYFPTNTIAVKQCKSFSKFNPFVIFVVMI